MSVGETSIGVSAVARPLRASLMLGVCAALLSAPALAQTADPAPAAQTPANKASADTAPAASAQAAKPAVVEDDNEVDALTVTAARKLPGAVVGDIPPEISLSPRDIRAYGVSSVSELLDALSPQTSTARGGAAGGRPVILVNGARISNFGEVRDIPTEAIARVEILPEEVALKYGYAADQKVVNLILRRRFRAVTTEAGYKRSTQDGGGDTTDIHGTALRILSDDRVLVDAKSSSQTELFETDRDLAQPRSDAAYRSLIPRQDTWAVNGVYNRPLGNGVAGSVNARVESTDSTTWLGLNTLAGGPLRRESESTTSHLGGGLLGSIKSWSWDLTANAERAESDSTTQRVVSGRAYQDQSNSTTTSADSQFNIRGAVLRIPAGEITTTFTGGLETTKLESASLNAGVARNSDLSRDTRSVRANIDVPLTSRRKDVLAAVGDLSLNLNLASKTLSDFGSLSTIGYGANWGPTDKLRIIASVTREQRAPSLSQIGDPEQLTAGVQTYDFKTGAATVITRLTGGNANLREEEGRVLKLGVNYKVNDTLNLSTSYINSRTNNLISSLPTGTSQIEDAFSDRFIRDAAGNLLQIDARPVNFDRRQTNELRSGFTFRKSFGTPQRPPFMQALAPTPTPAPSTATTQTASADGKTTSPAQTRTQNRDQEPPPPPVDGAPPPGGGFGGPTGGGFGGPGGGGPGGGGPGGGAFGVGRAGMSTFQVGLYHTVKFTDEITIRPGLAKLDLLDGASIGSSGGTPKNQFELQSNLSRNGLGGSLSATWNEGTTVRGSGASGSQDLDYSALTTVNLRLFADLGIQPALRGKPFFRGARVSASIDNLFDAKQKVRAPDGTTPITYQEDYLDPRGRTIRLSFRKVFFPSPPVRSANPPAVAPGSVPATPRTPG